MYAMVEISGKQYKAEEGHLLKVDRLSAEEGTELTLDSVVMVRSEKNVQLGTPYVAGATVTATVESHGKGEKIIVRKFKRRKNYHRTFGHRSQFSMVRVKGIQGA